MRSFVKKLNRDPMDLTVILIGLVVGMACMNLIAIFIHKENHTDSFQKNKNHLYEPFCNDPWIEGAKMGSHYLCNCHPHRLFHHELLAPKLCLQNRTKLVDLRSPRPAGPAYCLTNS